MEQEIEPAAPTARWSFIVAFFGPDGVQEWGAWLALGGFAIGITTLLATAVTGPGELNRVGAFAILLGALMYQKRLRRPEIAWAMPPPRPAKALVSGRIAVALVALFLTILGGSLLLGVAGLYLAFNLTNLVLFGAGLIVDVEHRRGQPMTVIPPQPHVHQPDPFLERMRDDHR